MNAIEQMERLRETVLFRPTSFREFLRYHWFSFPIWCVGNAWVISRLVVGDGTEAAALALLANLLPRLPWAPFATAEIQKAYYAEGRLVRAFIKGAGVVAVIGSYLATRTFELLPAAWFAWTIEVFLLTDCVLGIRDYLALNRKGTEPNQSLQTTRLPPDELERAT